MVIGGGTVYPAALTEHAAITETPILAPGFTPITAADPWGAALAAAPGAAPGTVFWGDAGGIAGDLAGGWCRAAIVFTPDRALAAHEAIDIGLLAAFDALAVLAPAQTPVHIVPPDGVWLDGGHVATLRATLGPLQGGVPDWLLLGVDIAMAPIPGDPGHRLRETSLAEEGLGLVSPSEWLAHLTRHLLGWLDAWQHDGPASLAYAVAGRAPDAAVIA